MSSQNSSTAGSTNQPAVVDDKELPRQARSLLDYVGLSYYIFALLGRLPFAMTVVGVFTLVVSVTDSYSNAGLTSATVGIGTAIFGPILGGAADRFGQKPVLLMSMIVHALSLVGLTVLTYQHAHIAVLVACAFVIGASAPQLAAMSRARLMVIISEKLPESIRMQTLSKSMSVESMADELVFVFGPVAVGLLAPAIGPWAPIVIAAVITLVCVSGFALHHTSRVATASAQHDMPVQDPLSHVVKPKVLVLVGAMFATGWFFGSMFTGLTSFMDDRGMAESTGVVYAAMGIGSAVFALSVVLFPASFSLRARLVVFSSIALAGGVLVPFASSVSAMSLVLVLIGIGLGPVLVTIFSLGSERSPVGRGATVMTMLSSSVVVGQSLSTALMGRIVDAHGTDPVLIVPAIALVLLVAMSLWNGVQSRSDVSTRS